MRRDVLTPLLIGLAAFAVAVDPRVLDPTRIGWLAGHDPATHYLGWLYFRSDAWHLPPGANPRYGLELANSILYSDSIPLFALLLKPLSPVLPEAFQYTGWWLLCCFLLQGCCGWRLARVASTDAPVRAAVTGVLTFSAPMLYRLSGHWALVGHWLIVAALSFAFVPPPRRATLWWLSLTVVASLVHVYLLVMVAAVWAAALVAGVIRRNRPLACVMLEAVTVPAGVTAALWAAGLFTVSGGVTAEGFGRYRMNLLAPINPMLWSSVVPTLPSSAGEYEGFNYLGLGGLLLALLSVPGAVRAARTGAWRLRPEWRPLAIALCGLAMVSLSNRIGVGAWEIVLPLPEALAGAAGALRASGRLFWPVYYMILLGGAAAVARAYRRNAAITVLTAAVVLQVVDLAPGWTAQRRAIGQATRSWPATLQNPFWGAAGSVYGKLRRLPPINPAPEFATLAAFAARHGLPTDVVYLARVDEARLAAMTAEAGTRLRDGAFDPDTLYVLAPHLGPMAPCVVDPVHDLLADVDGYWMLAPGWHARGLHRKPVPGARNCPPLLPGGALHTAAGAPGRLILNAGWDRPDSRCTRSRGPRSVLNLVVTPGVRRLLFDVERLSPARDRELAVRVHVDGARAAEWRITDSRPRTLAVPVPGVVAGPRRLVVSFEYSESDGGAEPAPPRLPSEGGVRLCRVRAAGE